MLGTSTLSIGSLKPEAAAKPPPELPVPLGVLLVQPGHPAGSVLLPPPSLEVAAAAAAAESPLHSPSLPEENSHTDPSYYYLCLPLC